MNFKNRTSRPTWAGGAYIFVTPEIADEIEDAFKPGELQKGHVVVSPQFKELIGSCVGKLRCKSASKEPLPVFSRTDAANARSEECSYFEIERRKIVECPSLATRRTHTTGSMPRGHQEAQKSLGPQRKRFHLKKRECPDRCEGGDEGAEDESGNGDIRSEETDGADDCHEGNTGGAGAEVDFKSCASELTAFTITDEENTNVGSIIFIKRLKKLDISNPKSSSAYASFIVESIRRLSSEVLEPLFEALPLEGQLAATIECKPEDQLDKAHKVLMELSAMAELCIGSEAIIQLFQRCRFPKGSGSRSMAGLKRASIESSELVSSNLALIVQPKLKRALQERHLAIELQIADAHLEGPHALADVLRKAVLDAFKDSLPEEGQIAQEAEDAWGSQKASHKNKAKEETKHNARQVRFRDEDSDCADGRCDANKCPSGMIGKEAARRENKLDKDTKGGRSNKITDCGRDGHNRATASDIQVKTAWRRNTGGV